MPLKCVVPGCKAVGRPLHRFPSPKTRIDEFNRWLELLHMDALYSLSPKQVYAVKRICAAHFDPTCKIPGRPKLHVNAVPIIGLSVPQTLIAEEPVPGSSAAVLHAATGTDVTRTQHASDVHRRVRSTPKAHKLYTAALHCRRQATRASKKCLNFKQRLAAAERYATLPHLEKMCLTSSAAKSVRMPTREGKKQPGDRQFTQEEMTLCLTLLKNNPKTYHLLQTIFTLPAKQTLVKFLSQMTLKCGTNQHLFNALKKDVAKLAAQDRYCVVMFDDIRLRARLSYNKDEDMIEGFVDNGQRRTAVFANRALVFMVRGIHRTWKQPVAFNFSQGATTSVELVQQISAVLESLLAIGLRPIATVCDQTVTNVNAVNSLLQTTEESYRSRAVQWRGGFFTVANKKIIPLYDMPHLLMAVRNDLLSKVLRFTQDNKPMEARWEHVVAFHEFNKEDPDVKLRISPKLTDAHVYPATPEQRTTVQLCSQVFSQQVAAYMCYAAKHSATAGLGLEAVGTAHLLVFFDQLFDSVNGSAYEDSDGKPLRAKLTRRSAHVKFWQEAIEMLSSMEFIEPVSNKVVARAPTFANWIATLRGLQLVWKTLQPCGFTSLLLRNFNQDALGQLFASIRCHGVRKVNPCCTAFVAAFKTLSVNNRTARHCVDTNYEVDESAGGLCTLDELLARPKQTVEAAASSSFTCNVPDISEEELATNRSFSSCGFVMTKLRPVFKKCKVCTKDLFALGDDKQTRLKYVSSSCGAAFVTVKKIVRIMLPKYCSRLKFRSNAAAFVRENVDFTFLTCHVHREQIQEVFVKNTVELIVYGWIKEVNRILSGKENIGETSNDNIKNQALVYYKNRQKIN